MKIPDLAWIKAKYKFLNEDAAKKGLWRSVSENYYEFRNRKKFAKLGVSHPDYCVNLDLTKSKSANKDSNENQPSTFYSINKALKALKLKNAQISMLDIGCGSGRVLSFGMLLKFKEVFGVDLDEPALEKATSNCEKMKALGYDTPFHIYYQDACEFIIPDSVNVVYMFNPFGEKTMEKVAANIFLHAAKQNSEIYVVYSNPVWQDIFGKHKKATKIFETFFKTKKPDIAIFKLEP